MDQVNVSDFTSFLTGKKLAEIIHIAVGAHASQSPEPGNHIARVAHQLNFLDTLQELFTYGICTAILN